MSRDHEDGRGGEDFASRWSRLKRETRAPAARTPEAQPDAPAGARQADERSDEEILDELGLPDPDTLRRGDDFKAFMASGVPARIRNRALRRLWTSNPVLANLDRLVDYDDDFTDAAMVPAILNTGYKVGRGWMEDDDEKDEAAGQGEDAASGQDSPGKDAHADVASREDVADEEAHPAKARHGDEVDGGPSGHEDPAGTDPAAMHAGEETPGEAGRFDEEQARSGAATRPHASPRRMRFRFAEE